MDTRPIGIFDSGLGGLTAVSALRKLMPEENIVYFGDTARNPYGTRSVAELRRMAEENLQFLRRFGVKAVLAACGTMSANVPDILDQFEVHVENVLTPSVSAMSSIKGSGPLAVIATDASIRSGAFARALRERCPGRDILSIACQDFVRLCETGHTSPDDPLLQETVRQLMAPVREAHAAAVLLGCTHFGLIADAIGDYLGPGTELVSASACAAKQIARYLTDHEMAGGDGSTVFFTSGDVTEFEKKAGSFLGRGIAAKKGTAGEG